MPEIDSDEFSKEDNTDDKVTDSKLTVHSDSKLQQLQQT